MAWKPKSEGPTHGWLISNRILRYLAWAFMIVFLLVSLFWVRVTYSIQRDCTNPYRQDFKLLGYWIHIDMGSVKKGCASS